MVLLIDSILSSPKSEQDLKLEMAVIAVVVAVVTIICESSCPASRAARFVAKSIDTCTAQDINLKNHNSRV
ncbi:hypothetical protein QVD17_35657 [Tagetes erecta]|uniref:Uncharacterized protein n=1 Tax=Tagetes erecta TaxID=13708 RepID=A0AAD8JR64_TARER|nr:hypothetical protein QVD17_35657 [Tagetes erecta]